MSDSIERFKYIVGSIPDHLLEVVTIQGLRYCPFDELLQFLNTFTVDDLINNPIQSHNVKLLVSCIDNIYLEEFTSISFKYERYTPTYSPQDNVYRLIDYLIFSDSIRFNNLHLLELSNSLSFQVSDAMSRLRAWYHGMKSLHLKSFYWLNEIIHQFYVGDINARELDIRQFHDNSIFYKIESINIEKRFAPHLLNYYLLGIIPNLKQIVFHMVDINELYSDPTWELIFSLLYKIAESNKMSLPMVKIACTLSRNIGIYNSIEESAKINIIDKLHFKNTVNYPKLKYSGSLGMVIPNTLEENSWNQIHNLDLDFIRLKSMSVEESKEYASILSRFTNIEVIQVFTHDLKPLMTIRKLNSHNGLFSKVESLALEIDTCKSGELNKVLPPSVKYMSLSIRDFVDNGKWSPPGNLNHLTVIPPISILTGSNKNDNNKVPVPIGFTITGEGVGEFNEPILMSCDWTGSNARCINIVIQGGPIWEEREIDIGSLPLSIERIEVGGGGYYWYFKVRQIPTEWHNQRQVKLAGADVEIGRINDDGGHFLDLNIITEDY